MDKKQNNSKLKFSSIQSNQYSLRTKEERKDAKYIKFGADNKFPEYLIDLYNNSSIHGACVNAIVEAVRGEGLVTKDETILDRANSEGESWTDIYNKIAYDYKIFGGFALEIIYSKDRSRIADVYHIDFSYVRAKEKNHRSHVPGYYINSEWVRYGIGNQQIEEIPYLPVYNPLKKVEEPNQIYVFNPYRPGQKYYPLPDYIGGVRVIDLDQEVDNFHINNIKNGLAPSLSITTFTNASDDERAAIEGMLRTQYAGTGNAGSLMYIDVDDPANAPVITPIPQNGADDYYTTLNEVVAQKILTAHRITSPMLLGIKSQTGLGNNAEEIEVSWRLFLNAVILPYQQSLLAALEYILGFNYPDITLGVIQKNPLYEGNDNELDVVTSQEADVKDSSDLDNTINQDNDNPNNEMPTDDSVNFNKK